MKSLAPLSVPRALATSRLSAPPVRSTASPVRATASPSRSLSTSRCRARTDGRVAVASSSNSPPSGKRTPPRPNLLLRLASDWRVQLAVVVLLPHAISYFGPRLAPHLWRDAVLVAKQLHADWNEAVQSVALWVACLLAAKLLHFFATFKETLRHALTAALAKEAEATAGAIAGLAAGLRALHSGGKNGSLTDKSVPASLWPKGVLSTKLAAAGWPQYANIFARLDGTAVHAAASIDALKKMGVSAENAPAVLAQLESWQ